MKPFQQNQMNQIFQEDRCLSRREIAKYIGGKLNKAESFRVENHILDCPLCEDALEGYDTDEFEKLNSVESFESFSKKLSPQREAKIRRLSNTFILRRIAAAVLVLIIAVGGFMMLSTPSNNELYQAYFETYESDISPRRGGESKAVEIHPLLKEAMDLYDDHNFEASLPVFDKYIAIEKEDHFANFYAGMANLESGKMAEGIKFLEFVKNSGSNYGNDGTWYLILAKLKVGERAEAKNLLIEYLKNNKVPYHEKGKALLEKI